MLRWRLEAEGFEMIGEDEQGVHEGIMAVFVSGYGRQIEKVEIRRLSSLVKAVRGWLQRKNSRALSCDSLSGKW